MSLGATESVCPVCLARIPARNVADGDDVFLEKECPAHGPFRTAVWRGPPSYDAWSACAPRPPSPPLRPETPVERGCPFDCGLCPDHRQRTCCVLVEVTQRCNLRCPFCFAAAGASADACAGEPDLAAIERTYRALLEHGGPYNIQLSGGEPTVRDDLPELVALGRSLGFDFIQLNTNGIRLARDQAYARRLRDAGLGCVFLQFDGTSDDVYLRLRGARLLDTKSAAIARCAELGLGVMLVPTVVPGVNSDQLGAVVGFALERAPTVRGVHFQPVSYFGRFPRAPGDADRITLPEVMTGLERQTGGRVRAADFRPPTAENPHCSFSATYQLGPGGTLRAAAPPTACCSAPRPGAEARRAREVVARRWRHPDATDPGAAVAGAGSTASFDAFLGRAQRESFSISGMAFQDAWNLDLARLRECFIHVAEGHGAGVGRTVPFCAFNLTSASGAALYRGGG